MILKIALYVLISILVVITLVVIIWRIVNKSKFRHQSDKTKIGYVSKKTIDQVEFFAKSNNIDGLVNLLVKNNFSKKSISLIPALFVTNTKVYVMTEMLSTKKFSKIVIKDQKYNSAIGIKNNKQFPIANFNLIWYKEIMKFIEKHVENSELIILLENRNCPIFNGSSFETFTFSEFDIYLKKETHNLNKNHWNKDKIIEKFNGMNKSNKSKNDI